MRLLPALTVRGWGLLSGGAALIASGLVIGERDLVGFGVLVFALPLLAGLTLWGAPRRVVHSRALQPSRTAAGSEARVLIRVANAATGLPVGGLAVDDTLPYALGQAPRFNVGFLGPRAVRDLTYRVRTEIRGAYPVGPLTLSFSDPLNCLRRRSPLGAPTTLLVTPPVVALPSVAVPGATAEDGDSTARSPAGGTENDPVPRGYQHGDDMRRVHWRSTARYGELMVRREEHPLSDRSAVLADLRGRAHAGAGPDSSLETAVSAAASVAAHLVGRGHELRLHTDSGAVAAQTTPDVLDALAVAPASDNSSLAAAAEAIGQSHVSGHGLVVAVLGALSAADLAALARLPGNRGRSCVALLCTRAAWPEPAAAQQAATALREAGWTAAEVGSPTDLPRAWGGAALGHAGSGGAMIADD
ncbi:DUF58 domain-containing protein [Streptomonospora litoralis]|uniref:DUF58 domain-containing protein n=1 Tax=Streptomonospora litoralis TaxID=2498135 RepID=A0A4P6Q3N2_9ACTN|nr:DUF58 domain-containing protein [Streptomonospora litoralis]QBI53881.1 hypothetical protein EKD16_10475 [Streptomonospora litoralis]